MWLRITCFCFNARLLTFSVAQRVFKQNSLTYRQPRSTSPAFQRHRRSWSDDSIDQASLASKQSTDDTHIYDEVPSAVDRRQTDEDEQIVRNNADRAREKRMKKRGSCDSSTDDEDHRRRGSFLNNQLRRSSSKEKPITPQGSVSKQSPLVVKTTEATIFGMESPTDEKLIEDNLPVDNSISEKGRRRTSSLHKLIEYKRVNAYTAASAPNTPIHTPRQATPSPTDLNEEDDTPRPTTLKLLRRERSRTEGDFDFKKKQDSSPGNERSNTLDNARIRPPVPASKPNGKPALPKVPPPTKNKNNVAKSRPQSDAPSETSTDSLGTFSGITSLSGEFNPLEEYDKIAQELNDGETPPEPPPKSLKKQSTVDSSDSAVSSIRDSLEVPSRPNSMRRGPDADSWSDFDNSSEGDDDSMAGTPSKLRRDSSQSAVSPSVSILEHVLKLNHSHYLI